MENPNAIARDRRPAAKIATESLGGQQSVAGRIGVDGRRWHGDPLSPPAAISTRSEPPRKSDPHLNVVPRCGRYRGSKQMRPRTGNHATHYMAAIGRTHSIGILAGPTIVNGCGSFCIARPESIPPDLENRRKPFRRHRMRF